MRLEALGEMQMAASIAVVLTGIVAADAASTPPPLAAARRNASAARAGDTLHVTATAYCQDGKTKSGARTRSGIVAADPHVLPVGSVLRVESPSAYAGIYTVMDTGGAIDGHRLDIFMPDCARAKKFGRQRFRIRVLRRGWNPKKSEQKH